MVYLDNHLITLNSTDATLKNGTYLSNVFFPFKGLLKDDVNILRSYVTVLNAQIPVSFYVIDSTNNSMIINSSVLGNRTVTIPVGNYNSSTLITALAYAYAAAALTELSTSINSTNGILTISSTNNTTTYTILPSAFATILGLGTSSLSFITTGVLPYPLDLLGKTKLFINSANLANVAYNSYGNGFSTTIAAIPVNVPPFSLIQYSCQVEQQKNILTNRVLDGIDIQILDQNNQLVNFNNIPWSITLVLSIEKMDANKFHIQNFNNYLENNQPIQRQEIELNPPEQDKDLEFLQSV
jgi:hypothetical protein